jgi:protein O-mannosyl-transferase
VKLSGYSIHLLAAVVMLLSFAVYMNSLANGFVDWDDGTYILNNPFLRSFDAAFFKWALFGFHASNWHPLTWLSHAADYRLWGLNPMGHHLTNVILHGTNAFLVTVLTVRLLAMPEKRAGFTPLSETMRLLAGGVVGLLFGLHPLHVESVAWVAERKDLLCAMFFILSILAYLRYVGTDGDSKSEKTAGLCGRRSYFAALAFFLLALLSKPMAVSLPLVLLILDWYPLERISAKQTMRSVFLEKLPFIGLSLVSSIITFLAQKGGGAFSPLESIPLPVRLMVAIKSLALYLWKIIVPADLVPFYPYPKHVVFISLSYLASAVTVAAITAACLAAARRWRALPAAWGYYVVTLIPVLGIVQVGNQAMADRYTYLPSIGPFIIIGLAVAWGAAKVQGMDNRRWMVAVAGGGTVVLLMAALAVMTWKQTAVWKDSITLWNFVIDRNHGYEHNAVKFSFAYNNRGVAFHGQHELDKAIADYSRAIELDPGDDSYYHNRAIAYAAKKQYDKALADNGKAFALNKNNSGALYNIACIHAQRNDPGQACSWLRKSIDHGYADWDQIKQDTDLDSIRNTPCYQSLMVGK